LDVAERSSQACALRRLPGIALVFRWVINPNIQRSPKLAVSASLFRRTDLLDNFRKAALLSSSCHRSTITGRGLAFSITRRRPQLLV
jgi:hypothetical protein